MKKWIRWSGLAVFVLVVGLLLGFWFLFIDGIVEHVIEDQGTRLVGAKVELDAADLSLMPAGLTLTGLQVTSPEKPMTNAVEIRRVAMSLDGSNLLRRKVIVEELTAEGVRLGTPRETSGAIEDRAKEDGDDSAEGQRTMFTMPSFEIPDAKQILANEDLETLKLINELKADMEGARETWGQRLKELPGKETFDKYQVRIEKLKGATKGGVAGALGGMSEVQSIKDDVQRDIAALKNAKGNLEEKLGSLKTRLERVKMAPQADLRRLQEKYSLSPGGLANLSETLLGQVIGDWARQGAAWYDRLKPVLEHAKQAGARSGGPEVVKPLRAGGVDVRFKESKPQPDFLIRRAKVSLELDVGNIAGTIENVTPDQPVLGEPLTFAFSGEELKDLRSVSLRGVLNHIDPVMPSDRVNLQAVGYRIKDLQVSTQEAWPVTVTKGVADLKVRAGIQGESLTAKISSNLNSLDISAGKQGESNRLTKALSSAIGGVRALDVEADVIGTLENYDVRIRSGLDKVLEQAAGRLVKNLSADLQKDLSTAISSKVDGPLKDLTQDFGGLQAINSDLAKRLTQGNDVLGGLVKQSVAPKALPKELPKELPGGFKLPF